MGRAEHGVALSALRVHAAPGRRFEDGGGELDGQPHRPPAHGDDLAADGKLHVAEAEGGGSILPVANGPLAGGGGWGGRE